MASNRLPDSNDNLFVLADDMLDGLDKHETEIGVKQFTATVLTPKLAKARAAQGDYDAAQTAEVSATGARNVANSNAKGFIADGKNILTKPLGNKPSQEWEQLGYPAGSIAMPDTIETRLAVLTGMRTYLLQNIGKEVSTEDITFTAAQAELLRLALKDGRSAVKDAVSHRVKTKAARDSGVSELRSAMSGLINELTYIPLGDDSAKWYYFGLVPPAGSQTPGVPDGLSTHQVGPTSAAVGWPASPRAEKYRLFKKVEGVDADFIAQELTSETHHLLENLPAHCTLHLTLTATNAAGESLRSAVTTLTLV